MNETTKFTHRICYFGRCFAPVDLRADCPRNPPLIPPPTLTQRDLLTEIDTAVRREVRPLPCWGPKDGRHYYDEVSVEEVTEAFLRAMLNAILASGILTTSSES